MTLTADPFTVTSAPAPEPTTLLPAEPSTPAQAAVYQQLRSHLAHLKLSAAAEALPSVLDSASAEKLTHTATMERLLRIEVDATDSRKLAARLRFASLPCRGSLPPLWR